MDGDQVAPWIATLPPLRLVTFLVLAVAQVHYRDAMALRAPVLLVVGALLCQLAFLVASGPFLRETGLKAPAWRG